MKRTWWGNVKWHVRAWLFTVWAWIDPFDDDLPLERKPLRRCALCGYQFNPKSADEGVCDDCWLWHQIALKYDWSWGQASAAMQGAKYGYAWCEAHGDFQALNVYGACDRCVVENQFEEILNSPLRVVQSTEQNEEMQ